MILPHLGQIDALSPLGWSHPEVLSAPQLTHFLGSVSLVIAMAGSVSSPEPELLSPEMPHSGGSSTP
jgi:hypothetical protein